MLLNPVLHIGDVIRCPPVNDGVVLGQKNRVGCSWVEVAGLAHRSRIDQVEHIRLEVETDLIVIRWDPSDPLHSISMTEEAALNMGVSEEGDPVFDVARKLGDIQSVNQIFILVKRRSVQDLKAVRFYGTFRQISQVLRIGRRKRFHSPLGGRPRHRVEPFQFLRACTGLVVVSSHDHGYRFARPLDDAVRVGTVSDEVTAAKNRVVAAGSMIENGLESGPVRVDVTQDQVAHKRIKAISGGAPTRTGIPIVPTPRVT
mgnify:CR=1 FL=1